MENGRYPDAYESFLFEFHATRDYFECHELLEEYWKAHPDDGFGDTWVGLIQLAVGAYHFRRDNRRGAVKMLGQSRRRLDPARLAELGIEGGELLELIDGALAGAERGAAFADVNIPLRDERLAERLKLAAAEQGLAWGAPSGMDPALVDRHTLRDRSEVAAARAAAMAAKNDERGSGRGAADA
ncbi:DUF309 domain-containing protein [Paenibacillus lycopersici]|uniref:DUF309 domain-containing protein n=1 Tax=Paenibacillus lycopersici TaxID=2704462 RepID=A0A6C0G4M2_9BACL|nr:DUF309 domain-containing protein [Paenibacillus lycopersici]QHT61760.1 DUF309 domain-containing protein [Paenibacillus lycopersici]